MNNSFYLLCTISRKNGWDIPLSEEILIADKCLLAKYIDDLLVDELLSCGLKSNDEPNQYGSNIETAIDYFNKYRQ